LEVDKLLLDCKPSRSINVADKTYIQLGLPVIWLGWGNKGSHMAVCELLMVENGKPSNFNHCRRSRFKTSVTYIVGTWLEWDNSGRSRTLAVCELLMVENSKPSISLIVADQDNIIQ